MSADTMLKFSYFVILLKIINISFSECYEEQPQLVDVQLGESTVRIGPQLTKAGLITLYTLNSQGIFHRCTPAPDFTSGEIVYSVLKNGLLIPHPGPYGITYSINENGDLIPKPSNICIYKSDKPSFYLKGINDMLIPVEVFFSGDQIHYIFGNNQLLHTEPMNKSVNRFKFLGVMHPKMSLQLIPRNSLIVPDKSCCGDIILFLLKSNGVLARNPPDEYLPNGIRLKYELRNDGSLRPSYSKNPENLKLTYITSENGNLKPCQSNTHTLTTLNETTKSYILGEGGVIAPVSEVMSLNKSINYFYDGQLIHSSNQFKKMYSNASIVYVTEKTKNMSQNEVQPLNPDPKFVCSPHSINKRDTRSIKEDRIEAPEEYHRQLKCDCQFTFDDAGKRIPLEPYIYENGKIALFKLTCKGYLKRLLPYSEPECNFEVHFKLLKNYILVPVSKPDGGFQLKYILKENGSLAPVKKQKNSFKKAPAAIVYYILLKDKQLLPVRLNILKCDHVEIYYQDCLIHTVGPEIAKELDVFTTLYNPMYAYCNSKVVVIQSDPLPKCVSTSTWHNPSKLNDDPPICKNLYLVGPNKTKIKIEIELNKHKLPNIYELDWHGKCHKSPKDDNKNMILRCFKLISNGLWCPSNDSNGHIYLVDKRGDMLPYCYPDSKLQAPKGMTVKYVLCKSGILVPILVQACPESVRFVFENHVIYNKRAFSLEEVMSSTENNAIVEKNGIELFQESCGSYVYYQKIGDCLHRHPSQNVEECLIHHVGFLTILDCGTLHPTTYPCSTSPYIKVDLAANGSLVIKDEHGGKVTHEYYILTKQGDLLEVEIERKGDSIRFFNNGALIAKQSKGHGSLEDELKVLVTKATVDSNNYPTSSNNSSDESHQITISADNVTEPTKSKCTTCNKEKCKKMRELIKDIVCKDKSLLNSEVIMCPEVCDGISDLLTCCSKLKRSVNMADFNVEHHSVEEEKC